MYLSVSAGCSSSGLQLSIEIKLPVSRKAAVEKVKSISGSCITCASFLCRHARVRILFDHHYYIPNIVNYHRYLLIQYDHVYDHFSMHINVSLQHVNYEMAQDLLMVHLLVVFPNNTNFHHSIQYHIYM